MVVLPALCHSIDSVDGVVLGVMTEVCGESGSGKSTLCMQLGVVATLATEEGGFSGSTIYINTKSPFPSRRLQQLMEAHIGNDAFQVAMDKIIVKNCTDANELRDLLTEIDAYIKANQNTTLAVRLLVLDSICALFYNRYPLTKEGNDEKNMLLRAVGFALKNMAKQYNIAVVACNLVTDTYESHNRNHFCTSGRIVKPKITWNFEKFIARRWILIKDTRQDGSYLRTLEIRYEDRPTSYCLFALLNGGVCADSYEYGRQCSSRSSG